MVFRVSCFVFRKAYEIPSLFSCSRWIVTSTGQDGVDVPIHTEQNGTLYNSRYLDNLTVNTTHHTPHTTHTRDMNILLTNDDGIYADGISALYNELLQHGHDVLVAAPHTQRSAVGHAITIADPLKVSYVKVESQIAGYAVQGTPADCVKLGLNALLDTQPDIVLSGINQGANTGNHILYSGTVSAATEATMLGCQAIAVSLDVHVRGETGEDYTYAAAVAARLCETVQKHGGLPEGTLLNVNVPRCAAEHRKGIRVAKQGMFTMLDEYEKGLDPFGRSYYWPKIESLTLKNSPEETVDYRVLKEGYVVISPIHYDLTDYRMLEHLRHWTWEYEKII